MMRLKPVWLLLSFFFINCCKASESEVKAIDKEMELIQEKLHKLKLKEMKTDVEGQSAMIADWSVYAHDMEEIKQEEQSEKELEAKLSLLRQKKALAEKK